MAKLWYAVHTFSNYEQTAMRGLLQRIKDKGQEDLFGDIVIPSETVVEVRNGKRREVTKRHYPGYMFVNMEFGQEAYHTVKDTPRVTGFVGYTPGRRPPALSEVEVARILGKLDESIEEKTRSIEYEKGENVRVIEGPFANFNGVVDDVLEGRNKLRVMVSIFGRATPVELDFTQVEKT